MHVFLAVMKSWLRWLRQSASIKGVKSTRKKLGNAHRLTGYLWAFLVASLFYVGWFTVADTAPRSGVTILFRIGVAVFFWAFGGAAAALVSMALPWFLAVIWASRLRRFSLVYFLAFGAVLMILFGGAASSLAPKPFFAEDQTFFEGFVIALQRQGIGLLSTGLLFGLTYWYLSERGRSEPSIQDF